MQAFWNSFGPAAEHRRLVLPCGISLLLHLAAMFWPHWLLLDITDVAMVHRVEPRLTARLVRPEAGPVVSDSSLDESSPPAPADEPGPPGIAGAPGSTRVAKDIYEIHEVDVRPWIRTRIKPEYPPLLPPGIEATTVLTFTVDEQGRVGDIAVDVPGPDPLFDLFAVRAFAAASYTQALVDRRPVKVRMQVAVRFNSPP